MLTNPSAVDRDLSSAYRILAHEPTVDLRLLFAPEHGFAGAAGINDVAHARNDGWQHVGVNLANAALNGFPW